MVVAGAHVAVTEKNMQKVEGDVIEQFLRIMKSVGKHGTTWVKVPSNTVIRSITKVKLNQSGTMNVMTVSKDLSSYVVTMKLQHFVAQRLRSTEAR